MVDYKSKYLEMKLKYINAKNKLTTGGGQMLFPMRDDDISAPAPAAPAPAPAPDPEPDPNPAPNIFAAAPDPDPDPVPAPNFFAADAAGGG